MSLKGVSWMGEFEGVSWKCELDRGVGGVSGGGEFK